MLGSPLIRIMSVNRAYYAMSCKTSIYAEPNYFSSPLFDPV